MEARTLASCRHPAIVRVARFCEAHYTSYMVLELERRGFDVGVDERFSAAAEPHRVRRESDADAVVWVVSGRTAIDSALARPGARLVVEVDPRSAAEVRRHDELVARWAEVVVPPQPSIKTGNPGWIFTASVESRSATISS